MYGFHAISTHNGWAMALAGTLIVFSGLVILSTAISQIHKILLFFETKFAGFRNNHKIQENDEPEEQPESALPKIFPAELDEIARLYQPLLEEIGETFYLSDLYKLAREKHYPHPHITFTAFRDAKILIPYGDGVFSWTPPKENTVNENE
ncbi:MAG: OadG family protein [Desulfobacterales bacterium]